MKKPDLDKLLVVALPNMPYCRLSEVVKLDQLTPDALAVLTQVVEANERQSAKARRKK